MDGPPGSLTEGSLSQDRWSSDWKQTHKLTIIALLLVSLGITDISRNCRIRPFDPGSV